jgi:hypothetical protein
MTRFSVNNGGIASPAVIAVALERRKLDVLRHLLPGGRIEGQEYCAASLNGGAGGSLSVNIGRKAGVWSDFATREKGGDLLDLWAQARCGGSIADAMREAAGWLGLDTRQKKANDTAGPPRDIPPPSSHPALGKPAMVFPYYITDAKLLGYTARFNTPTAEKPDAKEFRTALWRDGRWDWSSQFEKPRPLYRLPQLATRPSDPVLLVEGEKTADAAAKLVPDHVAMTWPGGGGGVCHADFEPLAGRDVVLWPDADAPGRDAMDEAARLLAPIARGVRLVELPEDTPAKWDLADSIPPTWRADTISTLIQAARPVPSERPNASLPRSENSASAEPFPVEYLGDKLADTARAIQDVTQAPMAICGQAVLATATLAAQAHADVVLPTGQAKPISGYFVTVAETGERKSSVDQLALQPVRDFEHDARARYEDERRAFHAEVAAHEAARAEAKRSDRDPAGVRAALLDVGDAPRPPVEPWCIIADATAEGIVRQFQNGRPSLGLFTGEGATFLGGYSLREEARLKTAADLSTLWDGTPFSRTRATEGTTTLYGRRFAAHLMVQPGVAAKLFGAADLRDQGLLSRVLAVAPATTAGNRLWREAQPQSGVALSQYAMGVRALLDRATPTAPDHPQELRPRALVLSPEARGAWIAFHDEIEREIGPEGKFLIVRGFANKLPEHAARLAAVITLFDNADAPEIGEETMLCGIELARFYVAEAVRLASAAAGGNDQEGARLLLDWLQAWPHAAVSIPDISRLGPNSVRRKGDAAAAIAVLVERGSLVAIPGGATIDGNRRREAWKVVRG